MGDTHKRRVRATPLLVLILHGSKLKAQLTSDEPGKSVEEYDEIYQ